MARKPKMESPIPLGTLEQIIRAAMAGFGGKKVAAGFDNEALMLRNKLSNITQKDNVLELARHDAVGSRRAPRPRKNYSKAELSKMRSQVATHNSLRNIK